MARSKQLTPLFQAVLLLRNLEEVEVFFHDLLTESELRELSRRFTAARMLEAGDSYAEIIAATGLSSTTVARVSRWLKKGAGGYRMILRRANDAEKAPS